MKKSLKISTPLFRIVMVILIAVVVGLASFAIDTMTGSQSSPSSLTSEATVYTTEQTPDDFANKRIGTVTANISGEIISEKYPGAKVYYFSSAMDLIQAMAAGKIDAMAIDTPLYYPIMGNYPELTWTEEAIASTDIAMMFAKNERGYELVEEFNTFLAQIKSDGSFQKIYDKWIKYNEITPEMPDYDVTQGSRGTITMAISAQDPPFCYTADNKLVGLELEVALMFCQQYGYSVKYVTTTFEGIIAAVSSGKVDMGFDCISNTENRRKTSLFSDTMYTADINIAYFLTTNEVYDLANLQDKKIGYLEDSMSLDAATELTGDDDNVVSYASMDELRQALTGGQIKAYVADEPIARYTAARSSDEIVLNSMIGSISYAFGVAKTGTDADMLLDELNTYIAKISIDGTLSDIQEIWLSGDENRHVIKTASGTGARGTLRIATSSAVGAPVVYVDNGKYLGIDIDILSRFAYEYGYVLEITEYELADAIEAVTSGKADVLALGVVATSERKSLIRFTTPYYEGGLVAVVKSTTPTKQVGFLEYLSESLANTFVVENRWQLFVTGMLNTLVMSLVSIILGTALGFVVYLQCRRRKLLFNQVVDFCVWLIQGMPTVVFLMVLFYIVFTSLAISGFVVSIIAFTLIFAASVVGMLRVGVDAVDTGQEEAAIALGYTNKKAFFAIVLPQAVQHFFPTYVSEMVSLLKGTAIVGYIAVQDLTKMADIVRSRTFDAFFPLLVIAMIYFVLAYLLNAIASLVEKTFVDSKKRTLKEILKGVEIK